MATISPTVLVGSPEYWELCGVSDNAPLYLMMNLPTECSLRCRKCGLTNAGREKGPDITGAERVAVVNAAAMAGLKTLAIIGNGEPTENFDIISEVIDAAHVVGMTTIFFTTTNRLTEEQAQFYATHGASIFVSLDSVRANDYRYLTGNGDWNRVRENIALLRRVYSRHTPTPMNGRILVRLGVNVTVCERNVDQLAEIREFASGGDMQFVANPPMRRGRMANGRQWERAVQSYARLENAARATSETGGHSSVENGVCAYFARGVSVDTDGQFLTCGYAGETGAKLPNARDATIDNFLVVNTRIRSAYTALSATLGHAPSCPVRDGYDELVRLL